MSNHLRNKLNSVLILTTDRQIDRRTLQQADSLENVGWHVTILAMPQEKNESGHEDPRVVRIEINPTSVNLKNFFLLSIYRKIRRFVSMNGSIMQYMKKFAWKFLTNQETFYLNLFASRIFSFNPHIVMAIDLPMLPVATTLARQCKAFLVYDSHELYSEQEFSVFEKKSWKKIEAKYIKHCHTVMTVNPSIAGELAQRYNIEAKVIYNAVPYNEIHSKKFLFHHIFNLPLHRKILLFQGGLSRGRNLETMIEAMCFVQNPLIDLVILGDGQVSDKLKKIVHTIDVQNRVHFHPAVPQNQLLDYTQSADAGLIPYQATCLNNYYCTPNKLFEFIAAGLPILASDLPEISNIVNTHNIGLTGTLSTAKEMAKMIDAFFSSEEKLAQWKQNVINVQQILCWHHEEKKLIKIFEAMK